MKKFKLLVGVFAVVIAGCECRPPGPSVQKPDIIANPTAISFSACPTKDETGGAVADVFPDIKKLKLNNQGVATDLTFSFAGAGKDLFSIDGTAPTAIDRLGELELPLKFSPTARGDVRADLVVDDNTEGTDNTIVTLIGSGINLPSQPTIETGPQKKDGSGFLLCNADAPLSDCILEFPDTLMGQTATLQLKIRNKGCPALKVKALKVEGQTAGTTDGFSVISPATLPSQDSPLVLSTADGTEETTITVQFTATDDGISGPSQGRYATLSIESNDAVYGDGSFAPARISLQANAVKPSIYVSPTSCNFTNDQDRCGNDPRVPNKASFRVTNDGATPLTLSKVAFRSSGGTTSADSRFSITQNIQGQTLQAGGSATLEVTEDDEPLLVSDQIEIVADLQGGGAGSGGSITLSVISGIKPCLSTDPADTIDFGDPAEEFTGRRLLLKNAAGCGTLILSEVKIAPSPFYSLVAPLIDPGTTIAPGGQLEATVQYKRPSTGGMQLGELTIKSNDTDYGPPQYKLVILQSNAAADTFPTAALTACRADQISGDPNCMSGSTTSVGYTGMQLGASRQITLSGANSSDDNMVAEYQFTNANIGTSFPLPAGGSVNDLDGNGVRSAVSKRVLTVPPGVTGTYRFALTVWDNRGQQSPSSSLIIINIYP
ncbi:MAG: choice-of-anchor D domain-containing protein [Archangium sp.]